VQSLQSLPKNIASNKGYGCLRNCLFLYLELDDLSEEKLDQLTKVGAQRATHDQDIQGALGREHLAHGLRVCRCED
jgi:hypothetical protein